MQVYRGMDIGTAKPSPAERARVPHHMIDVADPAENFSVARFQAEARAAIRAPVTDRSTSMPAMRAGTTCGRGPVRPAPNDENGRPVDWITSRARMIRRRFPGSIRDAAVGSRTTRSVYARASPSSPG